MKTTGMTIHWPVPRYRIPVEDGPITLDCACCGCGLRVGSQPLEDQEHVCNECGATCRVFFEDDRNDSRPYFGSWKCKHGVDSEESCDQCESENGVSV